MCASHSSSCFATPALRFPADGLDVSLAPVALQSDVRADGDGAREGLRIAKRVPADERPASSPA